MRELWRCRPIVFIQCKLGFALVLAVHSSICLVLHLFTDKRQILCPKNLVWKVSAQFIPLRQGRITSRSSWAIRRRATSYNGSCTAPLTGPPYLVIGPLAESVLAGASLVSVDMARTVAEREEKLDDAAAESLVSVRA